jgi:predicted RNA-binding Zn-ribbon protein involved in translation (DUF1610 family)
MCWYCGSPIKDAEPLGRSLLCPDCGKDLRSCRNCRHYLPGARKDCNESQADVPSERDRANFCDWFGLNPKFREATAGQSALGAAAKSAAKSAFDDLFNKH